MGDFKFFYQDDFDMGQYEDSMNEGEDEQDKKQEDEEEEGDDFFGGDGADDWADDDAADQGGDDADDGGGDDGEENAEEECEHEAPQGEGGPDADGPAPETRAAFNALRSQFKSTQAFVHTLYNEKNLQVKIRMLVDASRELHAEYSANLDAEAEGYLGMLGWAANRANASSWYQTIKVMIERLTDHHTAERLCLTPPIVGVVQPFDGENPVMKDEAQLLDMYKRLIFSLAGNRAWSQPFYGWCFPWAIGRLLSQDHSEIQRGVKMLTRLSGAILKLEKLAHDSPGKSALRKLLQSVGTHEWVVTREVLASGLQKGWDPSSNTELLEMAFSFFAGPHSTKFLENTINAVKDASERFSRNNRSMSAPAKWTYAHTTNYPQEQGIKQIQLEESDFSEYNQKNFSDQTFAQTKPYNLQAHSIKDLVQPGQVLAYIRKAGYTNRESAAACAFIFSTVEKNFQGVFLVPAPGKTLSPVWHFVVDPGPEGPWKHVPSRLLPPSCVPLQFRDQGLAVVFQQTDDVEPLGKAAVRAGVNLYDKQLRKILRAHGGNFRRWEVVQVVEF
eukprot:s212_g9.t1